MFKSFVTFFWTLLQLRAILAGCSCGQAGPSVATVIADPAFPGLTNSPTGKWCWQVALQSETGSVFCSAVLIDRQYAITPAQCIFGRQANTTFIRAGSSDLSSNSSQTLAIERLILHEGYLSVETSNDFNIGVIKLQNPIDCSSSGSGICLACLPGRNSAPLTSQTTCTATTWNFRAANPSGVKVVPRVIYERPAAVIDQMECESVIRNDSAFQRDYHLADSKICLRDATNSSGCSSGVGDPLVCLNSNTKLYELAGLNTIGYSCFRPTLPNFYVRVSTFVDWINKAAVVTIPTSTPATTTPPTVASVPLVPSGLTSSPAPIVSPQVPQNIFTQPSLFNVQHMNADGSLVQVGADGSVQRQAALPTTNLLEQVSPGVFRANIGGGFVQVGPSGQQFIFPSADGTQPAKPQQRRKRDSSSALSAGLISSSSSNPFNVPVVNVAASDVTYNAGTGKLEFSLPQGQTAFSSVSFVPSSVDSIRNQIIAQQDRILAQVNNANRNILISISNNFPGFNGSPSSSSPAAINTGSSGSSAAKAAASSVSVLSGMGPQTNTNSRSAVVPTSNSQNTLDDGSDDDEGPAPVPVATQSATVIQAKPVNQNNGLRTPPQQTGISSSAQAGGSQLTGSSPVAGTAGFKTVVNSQAPTAGAFNTHFESGNSKGDAGVKFQGANVHAETQHAPGSSSSSVSASSG
ncbi:putative Serine protease 30 [Hypsibius exemplaris]|uniref:Serine protease 30 n=1 Tax=Hypsibius exemplaris TaxID=2072580 RepID=A0A1W0WUP8_HYPEX|nr:putative Serine protease 30 [Hypsibius exemplaris]